MKKLMFLLLLIFISLNIIAQKVINVKQFGAKGNGVSNDTRAIQRAVEYLSSDSMGIIYFPTGVYNISSYIKTKNYLENFCIKLHSNLSFVGDGANSILRIANHLFDNKDTAANAHLFYGSNVKNISFSNFVIDMNGSKNMVPKNVIKNHSAIFCNYGENFKINNLTIKNCSGTNMLNIMGRGKNLFIENCQFINGGNYVGVPKPNKNQVDFSFIYSEWDSTIIKDNLIQQENIEIGLGNYCGGIELHGNNSEAAENVIKGCWPAIYITSNMGILKNVTIEKNIMKDCVTGVSFWINFEMQNIVIKNNIINLTETENAKNIFCTGISIPNGNMNEYNYRFANAASVFGLEITGNAIEADSMKTLSIGMLLHSIHQCEISENTIKKMNYGGIVLQGSKWGIDSVNIENNTFVGFMENKHPTAVAGYIIVTDTRAQKRNESDLFKNILVSNNAFIGNVDVVKSKNFYGAFIVLPKEMKNSIKFVNNQFTNNGENIHWVETN